MNILINDIQQLIILKYPKNLENLNKKTQIEKHYNPLTRLLVPLPSFDMDVFCFHWSKIFFDFLFLFPADIAADAFPVSCLSSAWPADWFDVLEAALKSELLALRPFLQVGVAETEVGERTFEARLNEDGNAEVEPLFNSNFEAVGELEATDGLEAAVVGTTKRPELRERSKSWEDEAARGVSDIGEVRPLLPSVWNQITGVHFLVKALNIHGS